MTRRLIKQWLGALTTGYRDLIPTDSLSTGDHIWNRTTGTFQVWTGAAWVDIGAQIFDWQESVLSKSLTSPPGPPPSVGDRYIIASPAGGVWTGHDNDITEWDGVSWVFTTPNEGFATWVEDEDTVYIYNGAAWVKLGTVLQIDHDDLLNVTEDQHHDRQHAMSSGADHTGSITDAQHGVRTLANAHDHDDLSNVTEDQHHNRQHALDSAADHTGLLSMANLEFGTWKKIAETVLGAPATDLDMTGLDLDTDKIYKVFCKLQNALGVNINISGYFNGDFVVTNYWAQYILANAGVLGSGRLNSALIAALTTGQSCTIECVIQRDPGGLIRGIHTLNFEAPAGILLAQVVRAYTISANLTRLTIRSSVANGFAAGSRAIIFGVSK